jgi:polyphosphate kinase 2
MGKKKDKKEAVEAGPALQAEAVAVPATGAAGEKMSRKEFEAKLEELQVELCHLQDWVKAKGARVVVLFEGRDTAGKGGVIKRITERVSPRVFRVVALPTPTEREKSQFYLQRYIAHLPAAGEVVLFDRSWYNRAGVERVMGFCSDREYNDFLRLCPGFERELVHAGIILLKYFLEISQEQQRERFLSRLEDPVKHWKLSPMDTESVRRWWDYTDAINRMMLATDTQYAPWYVVPSDDQRRGRLNCIAHMLSAIPYEPQPFTPPDLPKVQKKPDAVPEAPMYRNIVPQAY